MNVRLVAYESSLVIFLSGGVLTRAAALLAAAVTWLLTERTVFFATLATADTAALLEAEVVLLLPDARARFCVARWLDSRFL